MVKRAAAKRRQPDAEEDLLSIPGFLLRPKSRRKPGPVEKEAAPPPDLTPVKFEGLTYHKVYYVKGSLPKGSRGNFYATKEPPNSGYSHAFVAAPAGKQKRVTLFCPFTLTAHQVPAEASEIGPAEELTVDRVARLTRIITKNWERYCRFGYQVDYDVAALVLSRMGQTVPNTVVAASEEVRQRKEETKRGKLPADQLLKAVVRKSKRGSVCEFFLEGPKSLREAMAVLAMTRSGILTHLHGLNKDCGLGYTLVGDTAVIDLPRGCTDPFKEPTQKGKAAPASSEPKAAGKGKPLMKDVAPLKRGSKRAAVAEQALGGWKALDAIAEAVGCSAASVKSHLHDLHTKHGLGYEMDDKGLVRLLAPKGWRPA